MANFITFVNFPLGPRTVEDREIALARGDTFGSPETAPALTARGHRGQSTYLDSVSRRAGDAALRLAGIPVAPAKRRQLQPASTPTQGPSVKIC
jgi:hypothetical protein